MGKKKDKLVNMDNQYPHNLLHQFRACCDKMKKAQSAIFKRLAPNLNDVEQEFAMLARSFDRGFLSDYSAMCWQYSAKCHRMLKNDFMEVDCLLNAARMYLKANDNLDLITPDFNTHEFLDAAAECYQESIKILDKNPESNKIIKASVIREMVNRGYNTDGMISDFESPVHRYYDLERQARKQIFKKDYFSALEKLTDIYDNIIERKVEDLYADLMARNEITRLLLLLVLGYPKNRLAPSNVKLLEKYTWGDAENLKTPLKIPDFELNLLDSDVSRDILDASGFKAKITNYFQGSDSNEEIDWVQEAKKIDPIFLDFKIGSPSKNSPKSCKNVKEVSEKSSLEDTLVEETLNLSKNEEESSKTQIDSTVKQEESFESLKSPENSLKSLKNEKDVLESLTTPEKSPEKPKYPSNIDENQEVPEKTRNILEFEEEQYYPSDPETRKRLPPSHLLGHLEFLDESLENESFDKNLSEVEKMLLRRPGNSWVTSLKYSDLDEVALKLEELFQELGEQSAKKNGQESNSEEEIPEFTDEGLPMLIRDDFIRIHMADEGISSESIEEALEKLHKSDFAKRKSREEARKADKLARKALKKDRNSQDPQEEAGETTSKLKGTGARKKIPKPVKLQEHPLKKETSQVVDQDLKLCLEVLVQGVKMGQGDVIADAYDRIYGIFNDAFINEEQDFLLDRILKKFREIRM